MLSMQQLQTEVGKWSRANFDNQQTKITFMVVDAHGPDQRPHPAHVCLEEIAPLLGIGEELGELCEAGNNADTKDAVGDIVIYVCDYAARSGAKLPHQLHVDLEGRVLDPLLGLTGAVGRLYHAHLKQMQGIRKDGDKPTNVKIDEALGLLLYYLDQFVRNTFTGSTLLMIANDTWHGVVKKRDWKKDPEQGGGHAHNLETPPAEDPLPAAGTPLSE